MRGFCLLLAIPTRSEVSRRGSSDARAISFLKILELIPQYSQTPVMLFVENVVGFETSDRHEKMITMLRENHFDTQGKRKPLSFQKAQFNNVLLWGPGPIIVHGESMVTSEEAESNTYRNKSLETTRPICEESSEVISEFGFSKLSEAAEEESEFIFDPSNPYLVPPSFLERWGSAMGKEEN